MDRFQGRDKRVVLLSLVRSNAAGDVGQVLADVRRLNVAVSRAKHKLIIVGSAATLAAGAPPLAALIQHCREKGQFAPLPWGDDLPARFRALAAARAEG